MAVGKIRKPVFELINKATYPGLNPGRTPSCMHEECFDICEAPLLDGDMVECPICCEKAHRDQLVEDSAVKKELHRLCNHHQNSKAWFINNLSRMSCGKRPLLDRECRDPISLKPMELPVRGSECVHPECFDLYTYVRCYHLYAGTCPVCGIRVQLDKLVIDTDVVHRLKEYHSMMQEKEKEIVVLDLERIHIGGKKRVKVEDADDGVGARAMEVDAGSDSENLYCRSQKQVPTVREDPYRVAPQVQSRLDQILEAISAVSEHPDGAGSNTQIRDFPDLAHEVDALKAEVHRLKTLLDEKNSTIEKLEHQTRDVALLRTQCIDAEGQIVRLREGLESQRVALEELRSEVRSSLSYQIHNDIGGDTQVRLQHGSPSTLVRSCVSPVV